MPTPTQRRTGASAAKADDLAGLIRESEETTTGQSPALPVAPNWKFFLRHWPSEWSVGMVKVDGKDKPFWLPVISKHEVRPGVNLNRTLKRGEEPSDVPRPERLEDSLPERTPLSGGSPLPRPSNEARGGLLPRGVQDAAGQAPEQAPEVRHGPRPLQ
jgi:hypothetical protein